MPREEINWSGVQEYTREEYFNLEWRETMPIRRVVPNVGTYLTAEQIVELGRVEIVPDHNNSTICMCPMCISVREEAPASRIEAAVSNGVGYISSDHIFDEPHSSIEFQNLCMGIYREHIQDSAVTGMVFYHRSGGGGITRVTVSMQGDTWQATGQTRESTYQTTPPSFVEHNDCLAVPEETSPYLRPASQVQLNLLCNDIVSEFGHGQDVNMVTFPISNGGSEVEVVTCERSGALNNWRYRQTPRFGRDEAVPARRPDVQRCTHCGSTNLRTFKYDGADMIFCRQCRVPRKDISKNQEV